MFIYDHKDYKVYVNEWVKSLPKQGHGEFLFNMLAAKILFFAHEENWFHILS